MLWHLDMFVMIEKVVVVKHLVAQKICTIIVRIVQSGRAERRKGKHISRFIN